MIFLYNIRNNAGESNYCRDGQVGSVYSLTCDDNGNKVYDIPFYPTECKHEQGVMDLPVK